MLNYVVMRPIDVQDNGTVTIELELRNEYQLDDGVHLPIQKMLQHLATVENKGIQWRVAKNGAHYSINIENDLENQNGQLFQTLERASCILHLLAKSGLEIQKKYDPNHISTDLIQCVQHAAEMTLSEQDPYKILPPANPTNPGNQTVFSQ